MNMGDRIKQLRQEKGLTQEELGKYIGVKKAAIMKYEKGNVQNMKRSAIETLSKLFNVNPSYLMCLDEPKLDELGNPVVEIPILGTVKAGYDYLAQENWIGTTTLDKKIAESGEFFALKVKGDSMLPVFFEDDIVIFRKQNNCENNQVAVVIVNGDEGTLKKVKKLDDGGIKLIPFNKAINPDTDEPYYKTMTFTPKEIEDLPVIIAGVFQELKRTELKF